MPPPPRPSPLSAPALAPALRPRASVVLLTAGVCGRNDRQMWCLGVEGGWCGHWGSLPECPCTSDQVCGGHSKVVPAPRGPLPNGRSPCFSCFLQTPPPTPPRTPTPTVSPDFGTRWQQQHDPASLAQCLRGLHKGTGRLSALGVSGGASGSVRAGGHHSSQSVRPPIPPHRSRAWQRRPSEAARARRGDHTPAVDIIVTTLPRWGWGGGAWT